MPKYTVIHPIKFNGKVTKSGDVELPADVANELRASGHVAKGVADVVAEAAGTATPTTDIPPVADAQTEAQTEADLTPPPPPPATAKKATAKKAASKGKGAK